MSVPARLPARRPDRRRLRTRGAILDAGITLFAARPMDSVSIDDITEAADIAKGSFYNHFKDKDELAREVSRQVRHEVERRVTEANRDIADPAVRVARALCIFTLFAMEKPDRARALFRLHSGATLPNAPSNIGVRNDLDAGLASGRFAHFELQSGLMAVIGTVQVALSRALDTSAPELDHRNIADLAAVLLRGLGLSSAAAKKAAAQAATIFRQPRSAQ